MLSPTVRPWAVGPASSEIRATQLPCQPMAEKPSSTASRLSQAKDTSRYLAGFGPLVAGVLIAQLGGLATAATVFGLFYLVGLVFTPFAGPETKAQPLPD